MIYVWWFEGNRRRPPCKPSAKTEDEEDARPARNSGPLRGFEIDVLYTSILRNVGSAALSTVCALDYSDGTERRSPRRLRGGRMP